MNDMIIIQTGVKQVIGCDKDSYFVLDDSENISLDEIHKPARLLRVVSGAHHSEIVMIQYSEELSLIVTGTMCGDLGVWDYENSKLIDFCLGHKSEITSIHFLWPLPVMVTTSMDAKVLLWQVRHPRDYKPICRCLYNFENISFDYSTSKMASMGISSASVTKKVRQGLDREKKNKTEEKFSMGASTYHDFKTNLVLAATESYIVINDKGDYRGPKESERLRKVIVESYKEVDAKTSRNKIDTIFEQQ